MNRFTFQLSRTVSLDYILTRPTHPTIPSPICPPLVVLHGLFGSKQNWKSLSKVLSNKLNTDIYALDLRNHGDSPHNEVMNYDAMARDVEEFVKAKSLRTGYVLLGHSMGGKVAMHLSLSSQSPPDRLISVDMAPIATNLSTSMSHYVDMMKMVEVAKIKKQSEADGIMSQYIQDANVRLFLLTNLKRSLGEPYLQFRVPLDIIAKSLPQLGGFPLQDEGVKYAKPTLFIAGKKDQYVRKEMHPTIFKLFPLTKLVEVNTGHWVHSENPTLFVETVARFLTESIDV